MINTCQVYCYCLHICELGQAGLRTSSKDRQICYCLQLIRDTHSVGVYRSTGLRRCKLKHGPLRYRVQFSMVI
jgi:hypothetical protein